ncbi:MAG: sugar transferase, partial [Sodaliphilus sp.]|nr:sugar transferase [Sodaliphilus sp.]
DNCSFLTDIKIIISTIKTVLNRDGITQEGNATMEPFNGYN